MTFVLFRYPRWTSTALVGGLAAVLLFTGLASFGIWDPWELDHADRARAWLEGASGESQLAPLLGTQLVATGFSWFGVHEWAGRLPIAVAGFFTLLVAFAWVAHLVEWRLGAYAALIAASSPIFLLNARQMLGDAPAYLTQSLVALAATFVIVMPWQAATSETSTAVDLRRRWVKLAIALLAMGTTVLLASEAAGVLQGVLPPLWAVGGAALLGIPWQVVREHRKLQVAVGTVLLAAVVLTGIVVWAVFADHAEYSVWLGGKPRGGDPPTFEVPLEVLFHGFAPWSALLPIAWGRLFLQPSAEETSGLKFLRRAVILWVGLGYLAMTLFSSRYGEGSFLPIVPLAAAVAMLLRDAERADNSWWATSVISLMFLALIMRDFGLYPMAPVAGLGLEGISDPEGFQPARTWSAILGGFGLAVFLSFCAPDGVHLRLRSPISLLKQQWGRGVAFRLWTVAAGAAALGAVVFGAITWVVEPGELGLTVLAVKTGRRLAIAVPALALAVVGGQLSLFAASKFGTFRSVPVLMAGLAVGGYVVFGFVPQLSSHFSPRLVYDTYNELAAEDEPLGEFRAGQRAAAYYATGEIQEFSEQGALVEFLNTDSRRWAVFPADELAAVDRAFRRIAERHLFVADARSARVVLATNRPVAGRTDENYLADAILDDVPGMAYRVDATFQDKVELLGYDLDLPRNGYVGAGESFTVTWYWRSLAPVPGGYKVFLHVDGQGHRIHGDHDPVDGKYPLRLWEVGDVIVDRQELSVAANYRPGPYTFFIGFYAGENRLPVTRGRQDGDNRVIAGVLQVR